MRAQLIELTPESCELVAESLVVEHRLHERLAIVERAFERDGMHVGGVDGRHLPPLHVGDAAVRVKDEDVDLVEPGEGVDSRAAGVARGRADDGGAAAARLQRVIHELRQQSASPRP